MRARNSCRTQRSKMPRRAVCGGVAGGSAPAENMNALTPEIDAELDALKEIGMEAARALQSPWQPRCVSAAFIAPRTPFVFTMQAWIELDAERSPLLIGELPETEQQLAAALAAFGHAGPVELTPEEAAGLALAMREAVDAGYSTMLKMRKPGAEEAAGGNDGFGQWLPLFACLVVQCSLSAEEARALPVAQVFALIAAMRHNESWECASEPYALRDVAAQEAANG